MMKRVVHLDCSSGISGDMTVAALLGLQAELCGSLEDAFEELQQAMGQLPYSGFQLRLGKAHRSSIECLQFIVDVQTPQPERHLGPILQALQDSGLPAPAIEKASQWFQKLGEVEARMHGIPLDHVHFHEIGAVDSIIDFMATAWLLWKLGVQELHAGPIVTGHGSVQTAHGTLPIPAPATFELLKGLPLASPGPEGELITPTGAAFLSTCDAIGPRPSGTLLASSLSTGTREHPGIPGFLRASLVESMGQTGELTETLELLESNIDDLSPEAYSPLMDALFEAGALDVYLTPILMKKGRPAIQVSALTPVPKAQDVAQELFRHSTTLGIRRQRLERTSLPRKAVLLQTSLGPVQAKANHGPGGWRVQPEHDSCLELARKLGCPYLDVFQAASAAAWTFDTKFLGSEN